MHEADQTDFLFAFLDWFDPGLQNGTDAEVSIKLYEDLEKKLRGQKERLKVLDELADRLLREGHPDANLVDKRRKELLDKNNKLRNKCNDRLNHLQNSKALREFQRDADELLDWINERRQLVCDESYDDLTNLLAKLQEHQALETDLKTNKVRLDGLKDTGNRMINQGHYAILDINKTLSNVSTEWNQLVDMVKDKGMELQQAIQQELFNKALDTYSRLIELEKLVSSDDIGKDFMSVRELLKSHQILENGMKISAENLKSIVEQGHKLARAGLFNSAGLLDAIHAFDKRISALQQLMAKRHQMLNDSLELYQFLLDADGELLWLKDKKSAVMSANYRKNHVDTQNLIAKHRKLDIELQEHQPAIDQVLASGKALVKSRHFATVEIEGKSDEITSTWNQLLKDSANHKKNLEISLSKQKYLLEASEMHTRFNEKQPLLCSQDYGLNESDAEMLLTKHKDPFGASVQDGVLVIPEVTPLTHGTETSGVMTKLILHDTFIPTKKFLIFSIAADNQPTVFIQVYEGERPMTKEIGEICLGKFGLTEIQPVIRDSQQIEILFEIDVNGILRVLVEDKGTGNNIVIHFKKHLSPEDIDCTVNEAEKFSVEDKKVLDRVNAGNELESYAYSLKREIQDKEKLCGNLIVEAKELIKNAVDERIQWFIDNLSTEIEDLKQHKKHLEEVVSSVISKLREREGEAPKTRFSFSFSLRVRI